MKKQDNFRAKLEKQILKIKKDVEWLKYWIMDNLNPSIEKWNEGYWLAKRHDKWIITGIAIIFTALLTGIINLIIALIKIGIL